MVDDGGSSGPRRGQWVAFAIAALVAAFLGWLGPGDSSTEILEFEARYGRGPIEVGVLDLTGGSVSVQASDGEGTVTVTVSSAGPGEPNEFVIETERGLRPAGVNDVDVVIIAADGDRERVTLVDGGDGTLGGTRRPVDGAAIVLAILGAAMVLWVTEAIPLFVTSLAIPVALVATDVAAAAGALAPFFDPIIVLFFGGFLMAEAMRRAGLDKLVAVTIVDIAGGGPVRLYATMLGLSAFLSMWMSNTAAVAVLLPVALAVTEPLDSPRYRKLVVLGLAYAATIGGVGSAIGTPANPLAISFVEKFNGREISFVEWFGFGLPMVVTFLPVMGVYLWQIERPDADRERFVQAAAIAREQRAEAGPLTGSQLQVLAVFALVVALWLTQTWHGVNTGIVALGGAIALFVLGRLEPDDLSRISWPTLLTFGGGLTLGTFMVTSGTSDWLVTKLGGLGGWPELLAILGVAFAALVLTTVASNTAAAATLIPLAIPLAGIVGVEPILLVAVVAIATSVDFALVIGTPPTMLAYSTDLFTVREILKKGAALDVVGIMVLVLVAVPLWRLFGLV